MLEFAPAQYIDGIKKLHAQLDSACKEAYKVSKKYLLLPKATSTVALKRNIFRIFVDFAEEQPKGAIKGYFVFGRKIIRFASIVLDYVVLFPVCDHSGWDNKQDQKGITYAEILEMKNNKKKVLIRFAPQKDSRINEPLYVAECKIFSGTSVTLDDIGRPFQSFNDIVSLKVVDLPKRLGDACYTLVGKQYYAPYSLNEDFYCVLFAQLDNEHDENAIKVLRWFPKSRIESVKERAEIEKAKEELQTLERKHTKQTEMLENNGYVNQKSVSLSNIKSRIKDLKEIIANENFYGNTFFELGYVSRNDNSELHKFMVDNYSRLLFGKIENDKISLLGGIKIFFDNDFDFPASIIKIPII